MQHRAHQSIGLVRQSRRGKKHRIHHPDAVFLPYLKPGLLPDLPPGGTENGIRLLLVPLVHQPRRNAEHEPSGRIAKLSGQQESGLFSRHIQNHDAAHPVRQHGPELLVRHHSHQLLWPAPCGIIVMPAGRILKIRHPDIGRLKHHLHSFLFDLDFQILIHPTAPFLLFRAFDTLTFPGQASAYPGIRSGLFIQNIHPAGACAPIGWMMFCCIYILPSTISSGSFHPR